MTLRWTVLLALGFGEAAFAGYGGLMKDGEEATAEKRWDDAFAAYAEAKALKPKKADAVDAAVASTRALAVADGIERTKAAIAAQRWEEAVSTLDWIATVDADVPDAVLLRQEAEKTLTEATVKAWGAADPRGSYGYAIRLRTLFPAAKTLDRVFGTLRDYYTEQAETQLKAKAFEPALVAIRTIREFEPLEGQLVDPLEQKILATWADELVREAKADATRGRKGAAAMKYARAFAIAGREADRAAARALGAELKALGAFTVDLKVTGASARVGAMKKALENAVASVDGQVGATSADLTLTVTVPDVRCAETSTATPQSKEYVSGKKTLPNPEHARLTAELATAKKGWDAEHAAAQALWSKLEKQKQAAAALDVALDKARASIATAKTTQDEANKQISAAEGIVGNAKGSIQAMRGVAGQETMITTLEAELKKGEAILAEWKPALAKATAAVAAAEKSVTDLEAKKAALGVDALQADYDAAMQRRNAFEATKTDLATKLQVTSPTIQEDVKSTHTWDQKAWTRTCVAKATASARPKWKSAATLSQTYTPSRETTDTSNPGHAASGVTEDPKAYPKDDATLIAEADTETADAVGKWTVSLADEHYQVWAAETVAGFHAPDPSPATTGALSLLLGAKGRLQPLHVELIKDHLKRYGVEDVEAALLP